jgi:outer membrane biosynthesis protein TonB
MEEAVNISQSRFAASILFALLLSVLPLSAQTTETGKPASPSGSSGASSTSQPEAKVDETAAKRQVQDAIAIIQSRMAAMDARYGKAGAAQTLTAAYKKYGVAAASIKDGDESIAWLADSWTQAKPFYESNLKDLQGALDVFTTEQGAWPSQLSAIAAGMKKWKTQELQLEALFRASVDQIAQRESALAQAATNPKLAAELQKKAEALKTSANKTRASEAAIAGHIHLIGPIKVEQNPPTSGKPTPTPAPRPKPKPTPKPTPKPKPSPKPTPKPTPKPKPTPAPKPKPGPAPPDNSQGGQAKPQVTEVDTTVCKCKPKTVSFNVQTTGETVDTSDRSIATARIHDGQLEITGKKAGEATITVSGEVVRYNVGIPDAPPKGKGGIHGNGPNAEPLNGNYPFTQKVHVKVVCDLNGDWQGPMGTVKIIDSCGKVTLSAGNGKTVFSGTAQYSDTGYSKLKLTHSLALDEIEATMPAPVRQQVVGREASLEGTVGEGEQNIQGNLIRDQVHWVKNDDGSYSVTFPGKDKSAVVFTRSGGAKGDAPPAGGKGKKPN